MAINRNKIISCHKSWSRKFIIYLWGAALRYYDTAKKNFFESEKIKDQPGGFFPSSSQACVFFLGQSVIFFRALPEGLMVLPAKSCHTFFCTGMARRYA